VKLAEEGLLGPYNENDVELTRAIGKPYLANDVELADFYGAPLQTVDEATASFHARTLQGRIFVDEGVISDGTNEQRFPGLYEQTGGEGFVGGIVEIYQRGLFRPLTLVDFSSMYPSILVALGAGADNTRYEGTVPAGGFEAHRKADTLTLRVPDPNRGTRHEVSIEGRSPLAEELGELLDYRLQLKRQARSEDGGSQDTSRQGMVKVILNSVYGVMASRHARYASLPVAMAIVGTARRLIREVEHLVGDAKVETDTDGVYVDGDVNPDPIEAHVNRWLVDELDAEPVLSVDADRFEAGWFHEGKNYLLLHEDGRIERHGVAFKGSSRAPLFDEALDEVARVRLEGREDVDEIASQALDLDRYEAEDFVMRVRLGKDPDDYEATNHVAAQVARAAQRRGREPSRGDQIAYVKTEDGYDVAWPGAFDKLDDDYYLELLTKLLDRLGIEARPADQRSLAEYL
jgi:DNA polymerase I